MMLINKLRFFWIFLVIVITGSTGAFGQIQMEITADTNRMIVGDQQKLIFTITCDPEISINKLDLDSITAVEGFELSEEQNWVENTTPMSKILTKDITFTAFNPGEYNFPEVTYHYSYKGNNKSGKSKSWKLTVFPLNTSEEDIAPNKDIIVEVYFLDKYKWVIIGLGVLAIIGIAAYFIRKKLNNKHNLEFLNKPKVDPALTAKTALEKLRTGDLWKSDDHKPFQTALSGILRRYLADAHSIRAMNMTSHEIVQRMGRARMPESMIDVANKALNIADLVKFANAQSRNEINYSFIGKVENLVDEAELFQSLKDKSDL